MTSAWTHTDVTSTWLVVAAKQAVCSELPQQRRPSVGRRVIRRRVLISRLPHSLIRAREVFGGWSRGRARLSLRVIKWWSGAVGGAWGVWGTGPMRSTG